MDTKEISEKYYEIGFSNFHREKIKNRKRVCAILEISIFTEIVAAVKTFIVKHVWSAVDSSLSQCLMISGNLMISMMTRRKFQWLKWGEKWLFKNRKKITKSEEESFKIFGETPMQCQVYSLIIDNWVYSDTLVNLLKIFQQYLKSSELTQ